MRKINVRRTKNEERSYQNFRLRSSVFQFITYCSLLIFLFPSFSQISVSRYNSISVMEGADTLKNAWAGGINSAHFSEIDLNGDGIQDLFFFEKEGSYPKFLARTFLNDGASYHYAPEYQSAFPAMTNFALLRDYNCDGKEDIFTGAVGGMAVYRNDYTPSGGLKFTLINPQIKSQYNQTNYVNLYVSPTDVPAITDMDGDGDLDVLTFGAGGTYVEYHQNLSMDSLGTCDSTGQPLFYRLADACWGKFFESAASNSVTFPVSCKSTVSNPDAGDAGHSGSTLLAIDTDGDGDKDLMLGDVSFTNMVHLTNGGDVNTAAIIAQDVNFPSNNVPVNIIFPSGFYLDADNDGLKDLLVTPNTPSPSDNFASVWFYKNSGTNSAPVFNFQKNNFLQESMIDLGSGSNPVFFDHNADGLMDMVVGNYGYFNVSTGQYDSRLALFENTGTTTNPQFLLVTRDYANISSLAFSPPLNGLYPAIGDIDGDGDMDMFVGLGGGGTNDGKILFFENTAGAGNTANFQLISANYKSIDAGGFAAPQLTDVNRDGLLDLLVGERVGTLNYFRNKGTALNAVFDSVPDNDFFGGIDISPECCAGYSSPFLFETDAGNYSLLVGSERGTIYVYGNIDGNLSGDFTLEDSILTEEIRISISMADINNDGKKEIAVGSYTGGMHILKTDYSIGTNDVPPQDFSFEIFPNPNGGTFVVQITDKNRFTEYEMKIYNMLGEIIYQSEAGMHQSSITLDISDKSNGIYFLQISSNGKTAVRKLVKM